MFSIPTSPQPCGCQTLIFNWVWTIFLFPGNRALPCRSALTNRALPELPLARNLCSSQPSNMQRHHRAASSGCSAFSCLVRCILCPCFPVLNPLLIHYEISILFHFSPLLPSCSAMSFSMASVFLGKTHANIHWHKTRPALTSEQHCVPGWTFISYSLRQNLTHLSPPRLKFFFCFFFNCLLAISLSKHILPTVQ